MEIRYRDFAPTAGYVIYFLYDPRDETLRYVGQTTLVKSRERQHCGADPGLDNLLYYYWRQELKKAGLEPKFEVKEQTTDFAALDKLERKWINWARENEHPILNYLDGGKGRATTETMLTKADWIEIGYLLKSARSAVSQAYEKLAVALPKTHSSMRKLQKTMQEINYSKIPLDGILSQRYPGWADLNYVLYQQIEDTPDLPADEDDD